MSQAVGAQRDETTASASPAKKPAENRRGVYGFFNFVPKNIEDRAIASEIWLDDISKAAWATKESMRIAAMVARHVREGQTVPLILKDLESILSVPKEEVNRNFRMIKMFGYIEVYEVENGGSIAISLRMTGAQRLRALDVIARLDEIAARQALEARAQPLPLPVVADTGDAAVLMADVAMVPLAETTAVASTVEQPVSVIATDATTPAAAAVPQALSARMQFIQQRLGPQVATSR